MRYRGRRNRLDYIEPSPQLGLYLGRRVPRSHDKDIRADVIAGVCGEAVLPRIRAEADHRDKTAESVIDLAGFVPFQGRDDQPGSV